VVVWGRQVVVLIRVVMEVQRVPLITVGDLHMLINDIEAGKHDELLSGMTNNDRMETMDVLDDLINLNVDEFKMRSEPIVQFVDINTKLTSYAGATVVEYYARNNWAKHGLKRVMMNSKGFFFFKFDSRVGLEAVLEGGPWLICKSPVILKKWSMDTRLLEEELTRISIWVKLHDVPI
ncbi:zinc knuckle CX2CX4HX4C containing protein, partial [Tanacetum coccineum]